LDLARVNDQFVTELDGNLLRLLLILKTYEKNAFERFVTGDENCFALEFHDLAKWSGSPDDVSQRVRQPIGTQKVTSTVTASPSDP
jgi:hypothetical protein